MVTPKRKGRRWLTALATLAVLSGTFYIANVALAVHDEDFQLDGDVLASVGGSAALPYDWDSIFTAAGAPVASLPSGFSAPGFERDFQSSLGAAGGTFVTSDTSTYATGSKDTLPISGWQCNFDNNVNSKIDVMNAYAVAYTDGEDEYMYFALERNTNTGDANVGFWFLQDAVGCESTGGAADFTGGHRDGDVLVVSAFSGGGTVSTINVYRWDGDDVTGSLNPVPIGSGVDCRAVTTLPGDNACAAANTADITTPWLTSNFKDKVGNKLRTAEFFEGGINLTNLDLGGQCFSSFLGDTRSSTSLTATLFDYAGGTVGQCDSTIVTTPKSDAAGTTNLTSVQIPADGTLEVYDSALITVNGADTFDATVSFSLCGPYAADATTTCATGGVAVGTAKAVTTSPSTVVSDAAIITSAGRYCWRGDFSGDSEVGVPAKSDSSEGECFLVTPRGATLSTTATVSVLVGNPIDDVAMIGNTANQPGSAGPTGSTNGSINPTVAGAKAGGTITFSLYGPSASPVCTTAIATRVVTIDGDGNYSASAGTGTGSLTPTQVGTYYWVAVYSGNLPNTTGASGACGDANESTTVTGSASLTTAQAWTPNDTAFITSQAGTTLAGSVKFELFNDATCGAGTGTEQLEIIKNVVTDAEAGGSANSRTVKTGQTAFVVTAANDTGAWSWKVTYTDSTLTSPAPKCESTSAFTITD
jgi:hypothetical protein